MLFSCFITVIQWQITSFMSLTVNNFKLFLEFTYYLFTFDLFLYTLANWTIITITTTIKIKSVWTKIKSCMNHMEWRRHLNFVKNHNVIIRANQTVKVWLPCLLVNTLCCFTVKQLMADLLCRSVLLFHLFILTSKLIRLSMIKSWWSCTHCLSDTHWLSVYAMCMWPWGAYKTFIGLDRDQF